MNDWDVMVIGGGAAGLSAARAARAEGAARVALVERGRLGGECLHTGCVPSKALIEIANRFRDARSGAALGLRADGLTLDFPTAMAHVRGIIDEIGRDDSAETLQAAGIHVLNGEARFTSARDLEIDGARHTFGRAVIATGSDPGVPAGLGLERTPHLTNENVFGLEELPRRLAVLGGGPIGLELGQAFARLGSEVTVIEVRDRLLPGEDARVGPIVRAALQEDGVTVRTGATVRRVVHDGANLTIEIDERGGGDRVTADRLLVAAGRTPRTARLGLEEIGVAMGPEGIEVDERRRTSVKGIYACGDVTTAPRFTHVGAYDGVVAGRNAAGKRAKADHRVLPWIIFTDPEVARVGLTEAEARERHSGVEVVEVGMDEVDRARLSGRTEGFVSLITAARPGLGRTGGGRVVGGQVVGAHAGEILHEIVLAMQTNCFAGRLAQAIHAYPSGSMAVQMAALKLFPLGRALLPGESAPDGD